MSCADISQIRSPEEARFLFENALRSDRSVSYRCTSMSDYKQQSQAERVIQAILSHPSSDEILLDCLCNSSQSYCIFYVRFVFRGDG